MAVKHPKDYQCRHCQSCNRDSNGIDIVEVSLESWKTFVPFYVLFSDPIASDSPTLIVEIAASVRPSDFYILEVAERGAQQHKPINCHFPVIFVVLHALRDATSAGVHGVPAL